MILKRRLEAQKQYGNDIDKFLGRVCYMVKNGYKKKLNIF